MLIKRTERQTRRSNLAATVGRQSGVGLDRRSFLRRSGLVAGGLATIGALPLASVQKAEAAGTQCRGRHHPEKYLHALFGRLHRARRSVERRVGRSGAGLG